jgi:hypothetical protein
MPTARKLIAGLALALTAISCSDDKSPTNPTPPDQQVPATKVAGRAALLTNVPASGPTIRDADGLAGPTISGSFTIRNLHFNQTTQKLEANGVFRYVNPATGLTVEQVFTNVEAKLTKEGGPTQPTCQILILDLGPLHLDLLGLVVDLAPVHLDIHAQSGPGNLLGNLLCAVANLLNGPNLSGLIGAITNLLNQINAILMGL